MPWSHFRDLVLPGCISTVWGRSGVGKTVLSLNISLNQALQGRRVIYVSDQPASAMKTFTFLKNHGFFNSREIEMIEDNVNIIPVGDFDQQETLVMHAPFFFIPDEKMLRSASYRKTLRWMDVSLEDRAIDALEQISNPSFIIIDEITRLYGKLALLSENPNEINKRLAMQFGMLRHIARVQRIAILCVVSPRLMKVDEGIGGEEFFEEKPVASNIINYWTSIDIHMVTHDVLDERLLTVTCKHQQGNPHTRLISLKELFYMKQSSTEVM
ncbi:hypothetical protein GF325_15840 [Candidatus Bathyarchaeota archaeon]|nr:hypothetical protein [Candidatus Bathyarchaeota archaeon]